MRELIITMFEVFIPSIILFAITMGIVYEIKALPSQIKSFRTPREPEYEFGDWNYTKGSWYGGAFHGRLTASGERYDKHGMTCAHPTYPFGTLLQVERLEKTAFLRVTDRGPFVEGRMIDVSYAAAKKLQMVNVGVSELRYRIVQKREV